MESNQNDRERARDAAARLRLECVVEDDYATLTLKGEFDAAQCARFLAEIQSLMDRRVCHVIVDLDRVEFVNSTALGAIIKAEEMCRAIGGMVVLARTSPVVHKIVHGIGVDTIVRSFDDEATAVRHIIRALNRRELAGDAPVVGELILIRMPDETRVQQLGGKKTVVGDLTNIDGERVHFSWQASHYGMTGAQAMQLFYCGSEIAVKFQVKLFKKGYFELAAEVSAVEPGETDAIEVTADFVRISRSDRDALRQYAVDMDYLAAQRRTIL